jgi:hypothetical protein
MKSIRLRQDLEISTIDRETLVIAFERGHYYAIGGVASDLIEELRRGALPLAFMVASFMAHYERTAEALVRFVSESTLVETGEFEAEERPIHWWYPYKDPEITTHSELEDILVLDPIHDAGPEGWPAR